MFQPRVVQKNVGNSIASTKGSRTPTPLPRHRRRPTSLLHHHHEICQSSHQPSPISKIYTSCLQSHTHTLSNRRNYFILYVEVRWWRPRHSQPSKYMSHTKERPPQPNLYTYSYLPTMNLFVSFLLTSHLLLFC